MRVAVSDAVDRTAGRLGLVLQDTKTPWYPLELLPLKFDWDEVNVVDKAEGIDKHRVLGHIQGGIDAMAMARQCCVAPVAPVAPKKECYVYENVRFEPWAYVQLGFGTSVPLGGTPEWHEFRKVLKQRKPELLAEFSRLYVGEGPFATSSKYVGMFTYDADIPQAKDAIPLLMDHYKVSRDKICMKGTDPHPLLENDDSELFADFTNSKGVNRTHRAHYAIVSDPENKYGLSPSSYICGGYFRRQKETRHAPPI